MVQSWFNSDNLLIKFGPDASGPTPGGEHKTYGQLRQIETKITLSTLTSTSLPILDLTAVPKGVVVEEVEIEVQTAAVSGGSPTLDIGYVQSSDRSTVISNTAFVNAEVYSGVLDTLGKKITYVVGTSKVGGVVGTTTSSTLVGLISARVNVTTFSAGVVIFRLRYRPTL